MDKLYQLAKGYTNRFPNGNDPYQIATRILEECGEVASEVNHFEKSGIKTQKHGRSYFQQCDDTADCRRLIRQDFRFVILKKVVVILAFLRLVTILC